VPKNSPLLTNLLLVGKSAPLVHYLYTFPIPSNPLCLPCIELCICAKSSAADDEADSRTSEYTHAFAFGQMEFCFSSPSSVSAHSRRSRSESVAHCGIYACPAQDRGATWGGAKWLLNCQKKKLIVLLCYETSAINRCTGQFLRHLRTALSHTCTSGHFSICSRKCPKFALGDRI
jgi:hypothetical protein